MKKTRTDKKYYKAIPRDPKEAEKNGIIPFKLGKTYRMWMTDGLKAKPDLNNENYSYVDNPFILKLNEDYDIYEVVPGGKTIHDPEYHIYCSSKITLIRQITAIEIKQLSIVMPEELIKSPNKDIRIHIASLGYGLEKLVNDPVASVREEVAAQGYGIATLAKDENKFVRAALANNGHGLNILINDPSSYIRILVALQKYGLDKLVSDPNKYVRIQVARERYGLDKLVADPDHEVRIEVAKQEYGLDKLVFDPDPRVRLEVAKQEYGLDILSNDPNAEVRSLARAAVRDIALKNNYGAEEVKEIYGLDDIIV